MDDPVARLDVEGNEEEGILQVRLVVDELEEERGDGAALREAKSRR